MRTHTIQRVFFGIALLFPGAVVSGAANLDANVQYAMLADPARAGDRTAQYELGERYYQGNGVPRDAREAVLWWMKAALQAHPEAGARLAACIETGEHVPRDPERALLFWKRAAEWGSLTAQLRMAQEAKNAAEALPWIERAAAQGHPASLYTLARCYEEGRNKRKDLRHALLLFRRAAEAGHAQSMNILGVLLAEGAAGAPDPDAAYFWFYLAALEGIEAAETNQEAVGATLGFWARRRLRRQAKRYLDGRAPAP